MLKEGLMSLMNSLKGFMKHLQRPESSEDAEIAMEYEASIEEGYKFLEESVEVEVGSDDYPKLGSKWKHHSGREYIVIGTANTKNENPNYPIAVVYTGQNGNLWTKLLSNFFRTMTEIK